MQALAETRDGGLLSQGAPVDDCMLARFSTIRKRYRPARSAVARPLHS